MDMNIAANVQLSHERSAASVNAVTCNRCGCTSVAWVKSTRTGKATSREHLGHSGQGHPQPAPPPLQALRQR